MKKDSKLSSVLHVLLHMAHYDHPMTSEALASFLHTNPVVVRRTLSGLRDMGYVESVKGHGGGWTLTCDLAHVTLKDIYAAVGSPEVFSMGNRTEDPQCLVEQAINHALGNAFKEAEALLISRFAGITLADLAADFSHHYPHHD
jgi:DNA-binding IscR family transcriptional regulator